MDDSNTNPESKMPKHAFTPGTPAYAQNAVLHRIAREKQVIIAELTDLTEKIARLTQEITEDHLPHAPTRGGAGFAGVGANVDAAVARLVALHDVLNVLPSFCNACSGVMMPNEIGDESQEERICDQCAGEAVTPTGNDR
jgi:hypothetical protein